MYCFYSLKRFCSQSELSKILTKPRRDVRICPPIPRLPKLSYTNIVTASGKGERAGFNLLPLYVRALSVSLSLSLFGIQMYRKFTSSRKQECPLYESNK